ncbi:AraC family transcriptional regulator [Bacillus sp. SD088]|uniref:AraC family transcriptional regulator n=1 Tax=Bacillus sp. SD088 TaxID=2782012 RepID=UPI001A97737F|nr:AraC family transcriptional regulator [Bacillus sp. SD088]MBO0991611.1 AraC family transcriptional regulator [Bacillus sp. SD088]
MDEQVEYQEFPTLKSKSFPYFIYQPPKDNPLTLFHPHWHEQVIELIYMVEGEAKFQIDGQTFHAVRGDIFFIRENLIHAGEAIGETPDYYAILFNRKLLINPELMDYCDNNNFLITHLLPPPVLKPADANYQMFLEPLQGIVEEYKGQKVGHAIAIKAYIFVITTALARLYSSNEKSSRSVKADKRNINLLNQIIHYVEQHYHEKITLEEIASITNMSPSHFCRIFKKQTGGTFTEFVNKYRIKKSKKLLDDHSLTITDISDAVGFCNINYFGRLFRRYNKCTPIQYRHRQ